MASDARTPLEVRGLSKNYPSFRLDRVSFSLTGGTITGFIGRNGAGKSTTINSMLSIVRPDGGEIRFFGMDFPKDEGKIKERIGFVSAGMTYYTQKKLKTISHVVKAFFPGWDEDAYQSRMAAFGLDGEKTPAELSNGMKIKFALALALSRGVKLLMKEWKLCMHPTGYIMPLSSLLILVPGYPYGVCCFYTGLAIFFICLTARENHDAAFTLTLPVSRRDAARARVLFCALLEIATLLLMIPMILVKKLIGAKNFESRDLCL